MRNGISTIAALSETASFKPILSVREEHRLAKRIAAGDTEARNKLVEHNLRFVFKIAWRYKGCGVPLEDLFNEGAIGMAHAADRFDPKKIHRGSKFISYAALPVQHAIERAIHSKDLVRVPLHLHRDIWKMRDLLANAEANGRNITDSQLAEELQPMITETRNVQSVIDGYRVKYGHVSLDSTIPGTEQMTIMDKLRADDDTDQDDAEELTDVILAACADVLTKQQVHVLRGWFGFDGEPKTLTVLGEELGVSRERCRQVREIALDRIRRRLRRLTLDGWAA